MTRQELLRQLEEVKKACDALPQWAKNNYEQSKRAEIRLGYLHDDTDNRREERA